MSHIDKALAAIKAAAFDLGVSELARRARVPESTARRLLKKPSKIMVHMKDLEAVALAHAEKPHG